MEQETQKDTYLALLEASLEKKLELLTSIFELSKEQEALFEVDKLNEEQFNRIIDDKDMYIQTMMKLDEGFEQIYQRIKDELSINPERYQDEIIKLKTLITKVTDESVLIQVMEKRNKSKIEEYFRKRRNEIKKAKLSNQSAANYYKNMADQYQQQTYFFDKKK